MKLFQCQNIMPDTVADPTVVQTPLGCIQLQATINGLNITNEAPTESFRLLSGGWLICWHHEVFDLELLKCHLSPSLPAHMQLTDCWAGLWRLRANQSLSSCLFVANWENKYSWTEGGPNSGEWLDAKSWDDGRTEVSIGTADGDSLANHSQREDGLPAGWETYFRFTPNQFDWYSLQMEHREIGDKGLAVPLPPLAPEQQCQIHFAIAWAPYEKDGAATWYAVNTSDKEILAGGNCA